MISADVGLGFVERRPTLLKIIPEVQYAHWNAPASRKACCTGCRCPSFSRPSMVLMDFAAAVLTVIWQDRRGEPLIKTVHAPHCPSPHPYLVPVRVNSSRSAERRDVSGSHWTVYRFPLISSSIGFAILTPAAAQIVQAASPSALCYHWASHSKIEEIGGLTTHLAICPLLLCRVHRTQFGAPFNFFPAAATHALSLVPFSSLCRRRGRKGRVRPE